VADRPRPASAPSLTPLALVLFVSALAALGASVLLMIVAQRVAKQAPVVAAARADSLAREVSALRESLAVARAAGPSTAAPAGAARRPGPR
jgi:hypothetical protein